MGNVILLGDSIFDNQAYVSRGDEVIQKVRSELPAGFEATLNARDGAVIADLGGQLAHLPSDATHLVISVGGNDALESIDVLKEDAASVAAALAKIGRVRDRFATAYRMMLDDAQRLRLPTAVCTIYDAQFPDLAQRRLANLGLGVLNDVITRQAAARRLPILDLRVMFSDPEDYANPIEPSGQGGQKIARAIAEILARHDFAGPSVLYT
jgi:lysophospholipase L1-like esterase